MISKSISELKKFFSDRKVLLWVCQRYDLEPGEMPHEYDLTETEAVMRYRKESTLTDETLSDFYWESIWLEGIRSPLLASLRRRDTEGFRVPRKMVIMASEADTKANVNSSEFLPIFCLPGLVGEGASLPIGSRYDPSRKRSRERIAWDFSSRLAEFSGRLLIVIGAIGDEDLERLYEVLSERPILDLTLLVVLPENSSYIREPENPAIKLFIWTGNIEVFVKELIESEAPKSAEIPEWTIRVDKRAVKLSERDVARIRETFAVITEKTMIPPDSFTIDDLHAFFLGSLDNWKAYAEGFGLPVKRSYRTQTNESLIQVALSALRKAAKESDVASYFHIQLPCETGSGATTLLRETAFRCASEGFPTLVFRPDQISLDLEEVEAFATTVIENCLDQEVKGSPVFLLVFDVEHEHLTAIRKIGQTLSATGRSVVVLQATRARQDALAERQVRHGRLLSTLRADATQEEVTDCQNALSAVATRWNLDFQVPDRGAWDSFMSSSRFMVPTLDDEYDVGSKFWVALYFFLTKEMDFMTGERFQDALGRWIQKRSAQVVSATIKQVLKHVAVLSSFRLATPLWTVLRCATGGAFSSELSPALEQMEGIVEWGPLQRSYQDHTLRFLHPTMALEFLRQEGIRGEKNRVLALRPVLESLSSGHPADVWLAENLAAEVLAPRYKERSSGEWDWRIEAFNLVPRELSNQSKTVLHHWARCLYLSTDDKYNANVAFEKRQQRILESIDLLKKAIELPQRGIKDEHPSHLYNTLATAYSRLARLQESALGPSGVAQEAWAQCCKYFDESIRLSGRTNVEALLAFAERLIEHNDRLKSQVSEITPECIQEMADALGLLDEADDVLANLPSPELEWESDIPMMRVRVFNLLKSDDAARFIDDLINSPKAELGYFCHAQLLLMDRRDDPEAIGTASELLLKVRKQGIHLGQRSLHLLLSLLRRQEDRRFDFKLFRELYLELEKVPGYSTRPIDLFWHAVMCYQLGEYTEGAHRFAKLRERKRYLDNYRLRVREVWRDQKAPENPRETVARVVRIVNEFRAEGYIDEIGQRVFLRPRHWTPMPKVNDPVTCVIRFEANGPLAVPARFEVRHAKPGSAQS